jgi:UTP--glucose-1-phosphate uridylyltransferase
VRYDCGSKLGYLKASVVYGMRHAETGQEFTQWLLNHGR